MTYELVIVGAGPAGLAAAHAAQRCGLSYVVLERARIAQTVEDYPRRKPLHSPPQDVELAWGELCAQRSPNVTREELLAHYARFVAARALHVRTGQRVLSLERVPGGFALRTADASYAAAKVVIATGGFGVPRRLHVSGETPARVSYRFIEGTPYAGREVLVIGGGNSAAEAALWLHEAGASVTLSLRRQSFAPRDGVSDEFTSVKSFNRLRLEALAEVAIDGAVVSTVAGKAREARLPATSHVASVAV